MEVLVISLSCFELGDCDFFEYIVRSLITLLKYVSISLLNIEQFFVSIMFVVVSVAIIW